MAVSNFKPRTLNVAPEEWDVPELVQRFVELRVDRNLSDPVVVLEWLNKDWRDGVLPGVQHPSNPEKRLPYGMAHVAILGDRPDVSEALEALKSLRAAEKAEEKAERNREQLRLARRRQAALAEHKVAPLMYEELVELRRIVTILTDQLDRVAPGSVVRLIGDTTEELPPIE